MAAAASGRRAHKVVASPARAACTARAVPQAPAPAMPRDRIFIKVSLPPDSAGERSIARRHAAPVICPAMKRKARWVVEAPVRFYRYWLGFAALLLLLAAAAPPQHALAGNAELTPIVVALPEGASARTIGYYLAKAGGWFAREGLDPEFVVADERGPAGMLADGDADLAIDIMPSALKLQADGADIVHVAQIFQKSGLA